MGQLEDASSDISAPEDLLKSDKKIRVDCSQSKSIQRFSDLFELNIR